ADSRVSIQSRRQLHLCRANVCACCSRPERLSLRAVSMAPARGGPTSQDGDRPRVTRLSSHSTLPFSPRSCRTVKLSAKAYIQRNFKTDRNLFPTTQSVVVYAYCST